MTISKVISSVTLNGDGSNKSWDFDFNIPSSSEFEVILTDDNDIETTLSSSTYSVVGLGSEDGGTVTYPITGDAIASGYKLTINRIIPYTQGTKIRDQRRYDPQVVEDALDKLTMLCQQLKTDVDRSLKVSLSSGTDPEDTDVDQILSGSLAAAADAEAAQAAAETAEANTDANLLLAAAFIGGVKVSANDTTPDNLEAKVLAGAGMIFSTQNDGANETRTLAVDLGTSGAKVPLLDQNLQFSGEVQFTGPVRFVDDGELTIASGAITVTGSNHTIDTEGDASSDDLDTINGGDDGDTLRLRIENDGRNVVVKDGTGNIETPDGNDITLDTTVEILELQYDGELSKWLVVSKKEVPATGFSSSDITGQSNGTVTATDKFVWSDTSDGGALKEDEIQGILDLFVVPTTAGAVGTYVLAKDPAASTPFGNTIAGSSLNPTNAAGVTTASSLSGTWRCMGQTGGTAGESSTTIWVRIS